MRPSSLPSVDIYSTHLDRPLLKRLSPALLIACLLGAASTGWASPPPACVLLAQDAPESTPSPEAAPIAEPATAVRNSPMDAQLFYQVLISEVRARQEPGYAYQIYLQLGKQHKNAELFRRSVDIALSARAGEQALAAAKAWHQTLPQDRAAAEYMSQILLVLNRPQALAAPLKALIQLTPAPQRPQTLAGLPSALFRLSDRKGTAQLIDEVTAAWRNPTAESPETGGNIAQAWAASGAGWLAAGDSALAYSRLQNAHALEPQAIAVGALAVDLLTTEPKAEAIVVQQLQHPQQTPATASLRLAYARKLLGLRRAADAVKQLDIAVQTQAQHAPAWLSLGMAREELGDVDGAEKAILRYVELAEAAEKSPNAAGGTSGNPNEWDPSLGYLKLAQLSERAGKLDQADQWLQKVDPNQEKTSVQVIRAKLLASQGKLPQARQLIQSLPETEPRDAVVKFNAEAQLLREQGQNQAAYEVLQAAVQRFPQESDLVYDLGMVAEQLQRYEESEKLMRQLIEQHPDQANAYNALGYSLADRGVRLDEAHALISKAMALRPGDPFITDSMGWVAFRQGRLEEALSWLQKAYASRPDVEIAIHLGEVLWALSRQDEARAMWRQAQQKDADNTLLHDTLKRLKVDL